jgi:hypothetical protein
LPDCEGDVDRSPKMTVARSVADVLDGHVTLSSNSWTGCIKDDVAQSYLADCEDDEGVLFVGKAQEKTTASRTEKRRNP